MPKKKELLEKLCRKPSPKNFTVRDLDVLMSKCNCKKFSGEEVLELDMFMRNLNGFYNLINLIREKNYIDIRLVRQ